MNELESQRDRQPLPAGDTLVATLLGVGYRHRYSQAMKDSKRATVYFDRKATQSVQSVSHVVSEAVRFALAEDAEDLKAFRERASEKDLDFADVVKAFKRRGNI